MQSNNPSADLSSVMHVYMKTDHCFLLFLDLEMLCVLGRQPVAKLKHGDCPLVDNCCHRPTSGNEYIHELKLQMSFHPLSRDAVAMSNIGRHEQDLCVKSLFFSNFLISLLSICSCCSCWLDWQFCVVREAKTSKITS